MITWAAIVAGVFGGLWLLTWVVQIAAYAMFALAWVGWLGFRIAIGLACLIGVGAWAVVGPEPQRTRCRVALAEGVRRGQRAGGRLSSPSMRRTQALVAG